jgi:Ankyrin repeats (3 copies)
MAGMRKFSNRASFIRRGMKTTAMAAESNIAAAESGSSPFCDAGIRGVVFSFCGPGHWLLLGAINRSCRESYKHAEQQLMHGLDGFLGPVDFTCTPQMTLSRAVFASPSCFQYLAVECCFLQIVAQQQQGGLSSSRLQRIAGRYAADTATLQAARTAGLVFGKAALLGAAQSGCVDKLSWLAAHCKLRFDEAVMGTAAESGHLHVCQFLYNQQCPWNLFSCSWAASAGHVHVVRWLQQHGCPWDSNTVLLAAAAGGHISVMQYVLEQHNTTAAQLTDALNAAGTYSHSAAAQWLREQQGAEWPLFLNWGCLQWSGAVLDWARQQGCTSPTEDF